MSWAEFHQRSEELASQATLARQAGRFDEAVALYAQAATSEEQALQQVDTGKARTRGITAVSAVSLWFKAHEFRRAEQLAFSVMSSGDLPNVSFLPGQVIVSVKGGQVITGGAPLDLIVEKVQTIQALFYRTIEFIRGMPHRTHGGPIREIQEACKPWLFQAAPGSYQFSVAIQEPAQRDFFRESIKPDQVAWHFLEILRSTVDDDRHSLESMVPDRQYRSTFLKLSRNLAPTGRTYGELEVRSAGEMTGVLLVPENRSTINRNIREEVGQHAVVRAQQETIKGVLRAVHLDKDWLDVVAESKPVHISGLKDAVDDVIGPMVNRPVLVRVVKVKGKLRFIDIELDE
jgi:hypothetical protein